MRTVVLGTRPDELEALIARRHALGFDDHDEVWEGGQPTTRIDGPAIDDPA
jgi:hypothetical protein